MGNDHLIQKTFYEVVNSLREDVYKHLEDDLYESEIYQLGVYDITEDTVIAYIKGILTVEKTKQKLVNNISKAILQKHKQQEKERRVRRTKNMKLWKITKGKIPCLSECGYYQTKSKEEVLSGGHNFICPNCSKELENDTSELFKLFDSKNVYSIYNID